MLKRRLCLVSVQYVQHLCLVYPSSHCQIAKLQFLPSVSQAQGKKKKKLSIQGAKMKQKKMGKIHIIWERERDIQLKKNNEIKTLITHPMTKLRT